MYWSHHEKIVAVDGAVACVGGLDLCFGRWDTHNFPLSDVHPTDFSRSLFPGQDYNNARVQDFQHVDQWSVWCASVGQSSELINSEQGLQPAEST